MNTKVRQASHAGSWYSGSKSQLQKQLQNWMTDAKVQVKDRTKVRALIGPHAGYSYCGATAAHAYKNVINEEMYVIHRKTKISRKRVFVLGPSHHVWYDGCVTSAVKACETPFGDIPVCQRTTSELVNKLEFERMDLQDDEDEHSLEMHYPWIAHTFGTNVQIVPIVVGHLTKAKSKELGESFAKLLEQPENFMVISSDFCHWGKRFRYTYYDPESGPIYKSIQKLDTLGMDAISSLDPDVYWNYQKKYKNTICGRNPISILLNAVKASDKEFDMKFVHYSQSSKCIDPNDSSVSYAAGILSLK